MQSSYTFVLSLRRPLAQTEKTQFTRKTSSSKSDVKLVVSPYLPCSLTSIKSKALNNIKDILCYHTLKSLTMPVFTFSYPHVLVLAFWIHPEVYWQFVDRYFPDMEIHLDEKNSVWWKINNSKNNHHNQVPEYTLSYNFFPQLSF